VAENLALIIPLEPAMYQKKRTILSTEELQHLSTEDAPYGDLTTEPTPPLLALLTACPARCCELNDKGQVEIMADGCVEYGTAG
jgi:ferredoxin-like protein FixX